MSDETPAEATLDDLKQLLRWFATLFGGPKQMRERAYVERKDAYVMRSWLCALEAIARALLVILASGLPTPEDKKRGRTGTARPGPSRAPLGDPSTEECSSEPLADSDLDSDAWAGVSFRLVPPARGRGGSGRGSRKGVAATRGMALRFEALLRVAEHPERFARRMARRLARVAGVAFRILRLPGLVCPSYPHDDVGRALGHAWVAWEGPRRETG